MSIWLIRAGSHGEHEQKFINDKRVYATWDQLDVDMATLKKPADLFAQLVKRYGAASPNRLQNWVRQLWPFAHDIAKGDLVILPSKLQSAIYVGEVTGDYVFEAKGPNPYYHWRSVKWIGEAIPRTQFGQDLLYSFGAFLTICRIQRNNAEARINAMKESKWGPDPGFKGELSRSEAGAADETEKATDLEETPRIVMRDRRIDDAPDCLGSVASAA